MTAPILAIDACESWCIASSEHELNGVPHESRSERVMRYGRGAELFVSLRRPWVEGVPVEDIEHRDPMVVISADDDEVLEVTVLEARALAAALIRRADAAEGLRGSL